MNLSSKPQPSTKIGQPSHPTMSTSNSHVLLDKLNGGRATPDSDAMASSEDEGDNRQQETIPPATAVQKPTRRSSWLNDPTQPLIQPRKNSFASSSMSSTASHPTTPSADTGTWSTHAPPTSSMIAGRGLTASSSFPWVQGIWNAEGGRKEPPARLAEVFPSPPCLPSRSSTFAGDSSNGAETNLPFPIPLHPTPKTYRSQSYSVGQLEADQNGANPLMPAALGFPGRGRGLNSSGLHHRPSRPSMLSEMSNDGNGLGKLKEVEDDDEESLSNSTPSLAQLPVDTAKVVEDLVRENQMLRQQQQQQQNMQNLRMRPRSATSNTLSYAAQNPYGLQDSLTEVSDYAIDENDDIGELQDIGNKGPLARRMSEYEYGASQSGRGGFPTLENRNALLRKAHWQSTPGFGGQSDLLPPSRRHSFADVSTRHASLSSIGDQQGGFYDTPTPQDIQSRFDEGEYPMNDHASSYFGGPFLQPRASDALGMSPYQSSYNPYAMQPQYQPTPPHRSMYSVPQPSHNQLLYIVLFKCSRADVFYVQEGTGLSVKPGDLVIVEADRGTDLGTVAHDNVHWATAKELKEQYAEEHYKWLMMYSQGAVGTSDGTGAGLMAASNGMQGSAVGGMGPPTQHGMQELTPGELKPKIIKRLAQNHEIQALRDKEGNEAKAKRVCMQKVKEHGLHMEILDAEFQMDWKKLTFYYFADAYINFNSLVTDLFKVYKTRIWMSAINPASFASPSLGIQAPSGVGPGAVGVNQSHGDRRQQQQHEQPYNSSFAQRSGFGGSHFQQGGDRGSAAPTSFQQPFGGYVGYSFEAGQRSAGTGDYGMQQIDPFVAFAPGYAGMANRFPSPQGQESGEYRQGGANEQFMSSFQSLSLGGR